MHNANDKVAHSINANLSLVQMMTEDLDERSATDELHVYLTGTIWV